MPILQSVSQTQDLPESQAPVSVQDLPLPSTSDSMESGGHAVYVESDAHALSTDLDKELENDCLDERTDFAPLCSLALNVMI